jgi:hypothetical protein
MEMRSAFVSVTGATAELEHAIDAYLDDLPGTALTKRPKP